MTGIRSALEAGNNFIIGSEDIDNLAFTLVTPLQSENYIDFFHLIREFIGFSRKNFLHTKVELFPQTAVMITALFSTFDTQNSELPLFRHRIAPL